MSINLERAYMLMMVVKEAAQHGVTYKAIASVASAELKGLSDEADAELKAQAKAEAEKKAADEASGAAEAQRKLDLEQAPKGHLEQQIEDSNKKVERKI